MSNIPEGLRLYGIPVGVLREFPLNNTDPPVLFYWNKYGGRIGLYHTFQGEPPWKPDSEEHFLINPISAHAVSRAVRRVCKTISMTDDLWKLCTWGPESWGVNELAALCREAERLGEREKNTYVCPIIPLNPVKHALEGGEDAG